MAKRSASRELSVYAQQRYMGALNSNDSGILEFRYDTDWLSYTDAFPMSLSLPLTEKAYKTAAILPFLDNLLPDEEGVRRSIATRVDAHGIDPFSLLWELGRDCVGALQFLPADEEPDWHGAPEGKILSDDQVENLLRSLGASPLGIRRGAEFRISVAGAQEKTALLRTKEGWQLPIGATPSTHIIKPAIGLSTGIDLTNSVENEYLCMQIATELGMPTARVAIERFGDVRALVVERFDRKWLDGSLIRLPQEDLCQALSVPSFRKYDASGGPGMSKVLDLLMQSDSPAEDRKRFFQACYLNWVIGATDGHGKNFSIALGSQGGFSLTPLYDVMSSQYNVDAHQVSRREYRLAMAVGTNRRYRVDEVLPRHFTQTAVKAGISRDSAHAWMDEVAQRVPRALEQVAPLTKETVPAELFEPIAAGALRRAALTD